MTGQAAVIRSKARRRLSKNERHPGEGVSFQQPLFYVEVPADAKTKLYARLFQWRGDSLVDVTKWVALTFEWQGLRGHFKNTKEGWLAVVPKKKSASVQHLLEMAISYCVGQKINVPLLASTS